MNKTLQIITLLYSFIGLPLIAQENLNPNAIVEFEEIVQATNEFRPIATSNTTGFLGSQVGVSFESTRLSIENNYSSFYLRPSEKESLDFQKLHWQKGLSWPIDFGAAIGQSSTSSLTNWHVYLQNRVYESFRMPSIMTRVYYNQLYSLNDFSSNAIGIELSVGYNFKSWIDIFCNIGAVQYQHRYRNLSSIDSFSLIQPLKELRKTSAIEKVVRYGARVRLILPYAFFRVEDSQQSSAKATREPSLAFVLGY